MILIGGNTSSECHEVVLRNRTACRSHNRQRTLAMVSERLSEKHGAKELLDTIRCCGAVLVLSPFLIREFERVLKYPRIQALYRRHPTAHCQSFAEIVTPVEGPPVVLNDPDDDPVVYTALAGGADVICTVDRHFYEPNVPAFCCLASNHSSSQVDGFRGTLA
jgi:predicted nucleic acid-binding protein